VTALVLDLKSLQDSVPNWDSLGCQLIVSQKKGQRSDYGTCGKDKQDTGESSSLDTSCLDSYVSQFSVRIRCSCNRGFKMTALQQTLPRQEVLIEASALVKDDLLANKCGAQN